MWEQSCTDLETPIAPDTILLVSGLLTFRAPTSPRKLLTEVRALRRTCKVVLQEIREWEGRMSVKLSNSPMDPRLRPFALALGRLLAEDVLRHPVVRKR